MRKIISNIYSFLGVGLLLLALAAPAAAVAQSQTARDTALQGANTVLGLINDPLFVDQSTRPQIMPRLEQAIREFMDFEEFCSRTVGAMWREFTPDQKQRFQTAMTALLENTYIDAMIGTGSKEVTFSDEVSSDNDTRFEVRLSFTGNSTNTLAFRLMLKDGRWVVYDIIVEGMSLVSNYRDQFRSLMVSGNAEDLISRVEAKAAEVK